MENKLDESPYQFKANADGSLNFDIHITGTISAEAVAKFYDGVVETCANRMRYEQNAIELDRVISHMPQKVIQDFYLAARLAIAKQGQASD